MRRPLALAAALAAFLVVLAVAPPASARRSGFGLGLVVGEPTGLSGELVFGRATSLDFTIGLDTFDDDAVYVGLDYLIRLVDLARGGSVGVPLYVGFGGFLIDVDRGGDDHILAGPRVPFGLQLDFRRVPLVIFFELAVRIVMIDDDDVRGDDDSDLTGAIGLRFYF